MCYIKIIHVQHQNEIMFYFCFAHIYKNRREQVRLLIHSFKSQKTFLNKLKLSYKSRKYKKPSYNSKTWKKWLTLAAWSFWSTWSAWRTCTCPGPTCPPRPTWLRRARRWWARWEVWRSGASGASRARGWVLSAWKRFVSVKNETVSWWENVTCMILL